MSPSLILRKRKKTIYLSLAIFPFLLTSFLIFFSSSCRLYKLERKLDPVNAEFLSKVRYIITRKERKIFLELPDSEKGKFREEFWKRRDSSPDTEENEFKMEYFGRIEEADRLFVGEGRPGWLTDRGRIHVLFGPPSFRETHHIESRHPNLLYGRCGEIWHYDGWPVVFVDSTCTGYYQLVTYDLTGLRSINLMYLHEFSKAQASAQKTFEKEKGFFDFDWRVEKTVVEADRVEGIIIIEIPYAAIWYKAVDDRLETTLDVRLKLKDSEENLIWEYEEASKISMMEDELKERQDIMHKIEIPFILEESLDKLRHGKIMFHILLRNRTGGEELKKVMEFKL